VHLYLAGPREQANGVRFTYPEPPERSAVCVPVALPRSVGS
jgi:hypothetical protein